MRWSEIAGSNYVVETFDSSASVDWAEQSNRLWKGFFEVDNIPFKLSFVHVQDKGYWEVSFVLERGKLKDQDALAKLRSKSIISYGNTGLSGRAGLQVFSTMIQAVGRLIKTVQPDKIVFSGDIDDGRDLLYARMLKKFHSTIASLGYSLQQETVPGETVFSLVKNS